MRLFAEYAPAYWAAGLPVVPLRAREKRPIPEGWSSFADHLPDENLQQAWLGAYPEGNIGLVLGPQSGILVVDIDTDDPRAQQVLERLLPPSPWKRIGRKGAVLAYRYNGQATFRVKTEEGKTLVEVLSTGTQVVLPPSIHPDTGMPYTANADLLEVKDMLPALPREIEAMMRGGLEEAGYNLSHSGYTKITEFIAAGARDNAMVAHAGILARAITRGERNLLEAFSEIEHWCNTWVERIEGDVIDAQKGKQRICQFLVRDVLGERRLSLPRGWDAGLTDEMKRAFGLNFNEEHEEWDFDRLKDHLVDAFSQYTSEGSGRSRAIEYVMERLARSRNIHQLDEERLLQWIVQSSGLNYNLSALKRHLRQLRQGDIQGNDHTEIAQAVIEELSQFGDFRHYNGVFWQWKGADWGQMAEEEILRFIAEEFGSFQAARRQSDHVGILKVMRSLAEKPLKETTLYGINFSNGFLTSDLELLPHHPSFGATYTLPYGYRPELEDRAFRWHEFLKSCWGSDPDYADKVQALREAIAVTLFGLGPRYSRAICLYGAASSGKTQILKVVKGLMPERSYSAVPPSDWGDRFLPTELHDKLLNICGELSEDKLIDGERFKLIIEGSEINGQYKGKQIFKFQPHCTHWFASNHMPKTRDTSAGFNRRWLILQFTKTVGTEERVVDIGISLLADEREAIAAWAVKAIRDITERKEFLIPDSHKQLIGEVANMNNSLRFFLTASGLVSVDPTGSENGNRTTETKLHDAYYSFCRSSGAARPVSWKIFRIKMRELAPELGFKILPFRDDKGQDQAWYVNLTLVEDRVGLKRSGTS